MSADELISPFETFASEARTAGRTLEYPIPLDAKLRSDIRFFFAGDFKLRPPSAESASAILRVPVKCAGAEALSPRNADSSTACVGGRRLERRRAFSMRSGPMFERRRETFIAAAERGVGGGRSSAGLLFILRRSAATALEGKGGRCTPPPTPLLLLVVLLLLLASNVNEFRLRSESARLSVVALSPFSSSSLRLLSVDAPRDLRKLGSSRLPRRVRVAPA